MRSYQTIIHAWWLVIFAGSVLVLVLFATRTRNGYNMSQLQNLTVPKPVSPMDNMQTRYIENNEPPKYPHMILPKPELKSCVPLNFTSSEKPPTSSSQVPFSEGLKKTPKPSKVLDNVKPKENKIERSCSMFEGKWVHDPRQSPLYNSAMCPFLSDRASCQRNGRPDKGYERWRWEANECMIPRFDAKDLLERLRGKRVVIVGDSIGFGQWESLACILYSAIPHQSQVDVRNRVFTAKSYNLIVESRWAEFLVEVLVNKSSGKKILNLDSLSPTAQTWKGADIMVFNTGHWWMSRQRWDWFLFQQKLYTYMKLERAFKLAMQTWGRWIEKNVDKSKTMVFFRGMSPGHSGRHKCYRATQPIKGDEAFKLKNSESKIIGIVERTIQGMKGKMAVKYLNVTRLTELRKDAHSSIYWKKQSKVGPDCSHWCLPGVPDTWNHLLYATLVFEGISNS